MRTRSTSHLSGTALALLALSPLSVPAQRASDDGARVVATIEALFNAAERGDMAALDTFWVVPDAQTSGRARRPTDPPPPTR